MKLKHYRIVKDKYAGYEVQVWRLYFPFWVTASDERTGSMVNTHSSFEEAKDAILRKRNKRTKPPMVVVWIET